MYTLRLRVTDRELVNVVKLTAPLFDVQTILKLSCLIVLHRPPLLPSNGQPLTSPEGTARYPERHTRLHAITFHKQPAERCRLGRKEVAMACLFTSLQGLNKPVKNLSSTLFRFIVVTLDRLCGLVVRVPVYTTEMYCASCEVRTEFIYVM
jgi:hypothetical protein